jgi:hypothetical protein
MAKADRRELVNRLVILLAHLLKWQYQLGQLSEIWEKFQGSSWRASIIEQRARIRKELRDLPSLKGYFAEAMAKAYPDAVELAADESGLPVETFPPVCPYTAEQLLDKTFFPAAQK